MWGNPWQGQVPCHPLDARKLVYVEVPKAGCTSVKWALSGFRGGPPGEGESIHGWMGYTHAASSGQLHDWLEGRWADFYRFTVVRHPVTRFESFYWGLPPYERGAWGDINRYVLEDFGHDDLARDIHATPQTSILGHVGGFDYVGRLEDIAQLQRRLTRVLGSSVAIPRLNVSASEMKLTDDAQDRLRSLYAADMETFGYE